MCCDSKSINTWWILNTVKIFNITIWNISYFILSLCTQSDLELGIIPRWLPEGRITGTHHSVIEALSEDLWSVWNCRSLARTGKGVHSLPPGKAIVENISRNCFHIQLWLKSRCGIDVKFSLLKLDEGLFYNYLYLYILFWNFPQHNALSFFFF